jgi:hypothetical protein
MELLLKVLKSYNVIAYETYGAKEMMLRAELQRELLKLTNTFSVDKMWSICMSDVVVSYN